VNKFARAWSRHAWIPALAAVAALAAPAASASAACSNEALRTGASANLPDCRALELVSPAEKRGYDVELTGVRAAATGNGVVFQSHGLIGAGGSSPVYTDSLARRLTTGGGWSVDGISPPVNPEGSTIASTPFFNWTSDLSEALLQVSPNSPQDDGASPSAQDIYLHDILGGTYALVTHTPAAEPKPQYGGSSVDLRHVVFGDTEALPVTDGPDAPAGAASNLYETFDGHLQLVGIGTDGAPLPAGAVLGAGEGITGNTSRAVSTDGSRVAFTSPPGEGQLFVRVDGTRTLEASAPQPTVVDPLGPRPATYWTASADGEEIFFTSSAKLTANASTGPMDEGNDLYRYDVGSEELTDLTALPVGESNGAEVQGVVGASEDGSQVYFVASGQLDGEEGTPGFPNLYVWHDGASHFIASLGFGDFEDWWGLRLLHPATDPARVSADGTEALITTAAAQPGFDNAEHKEIYRYAEGETPSWICVSCVEANQPATGDASLSVSPEAVVPQLNGEYLTRALLGDGTVFFDSAEALTADDEDEGIDVYEWRDGRLSLLSGGADSAPAYFGDASPDGMDIYIATRSRLVAEDGDNLVDVYDARVDGGIPVEARTPPCEGRDCRGPLTQAQVGTTPNSSTFTGPGDPAPKHRAAKRHKHKKPRRHRHHRGSHERNATRSSRG
jgi:hypothetical protein